MRLNMGMVLLSIFTLFEGKKRITKMIFHGFECKTGGEGDDKRRVVC